MFKYSFSKCLCTHRRTLSQNSITWTSV